ILPATFPSVTFLPAAIPGAAGRSGTRGGADRPAWGRIGDVVAGLLVALAIGGWAGGPCAAEPAAPADGEAGYRATVAPFFRKHCGACHGVAKPEGGFSVARRELGIDFTLPAVRSKWREVVNVLNSHEMPPEDRPQPEPAETAAVVDWITRQAVAAELAARQHEVVIRRLNRAEYRNTIRDLVGVDFDTSGFPQDPPAGGFDNIGAALTMSPMQIEQYLAAAEQILDRALVEGPRPETVSWRFDPEPGSNDRNRVRLDARNNPIVKGGANRYEGDWVVVHREHWDQFNVRDFRMAVPGTYTIRARVAGRRPTREQVVESAAEILRERQAKQDAEKPDRAEWNRKQYEDDLGHFREDRMYDYGPPRLKLVVQLGAQPRTVAEFDVEGTPESPQIVEFPVRFTTEQAGVSLVYAYDIPAVLENFWLQGRDEFARPDALIDWIEIEGPVHDAWPPSSHTRMLFDSPLREADPDAYVRQLIARFMEAAWRRPVSDAEVDEKLALDAAAADGRRSLVQRIKPPLMAILTSPHFLYLAEPHADGGDRRLTQHEIAARLSYVLWSSQPDAELGRLAREGRLADPRTRRDQVDRLLAAAGSEEFVRNFAGQWLGLREVGANPPAKDLYPQYDRHLETSIVGESEAYFRTFLREDLDARRMIKSDFVTINERLGRFYGIPGVRGDAFRSVPVPAGVTRGGIVTQASVLTITSNGTRTSPVKRGTWILKTLLGIDPGLPVANAGEIAPKVPGIDKATVRQRLEIHRELPQCARCHDKIDPLGFALEHYNAAGEWREQEGFGYKGRIQRNDPAIDASSRMPDGTRIDGVAGLQEAMLAQDGRFLTALAARMTTYALGRELGLADQPLVDEVVAAMRRDGTTLRALVKAIVGSEAFTEK
ncbi:MAG: DUF1592 domain-containing protein, partial [Planctomycetia bacterium]